MRDNIKESVYFDPENDLFCYLISDEMYYADHLSLRVSLYRSFETNEIIGFELNGTDEIRNPREITPEEEAELMEWMKKVGGFNIC